MAGLKSRLWVNLKNEPNEIGALCDNISPLIILEYIQVETNLHTEYGIVETTSVNTFINISLK